MNNRIANDLIRYAELVEDGALISPEEMNCASVMRLAAEYLVQPAQPAEGEDTRRAWVGLSHDEYDALCDKHSAMSDFDFLEDIEAKLKEKNTRNGGCL